MARPGALDRRAIEPSTAPRLRHVPALDGLRGVAVAGVVAYHLGYLRGGYLGVDAFFVLSGYLITALLVAEWQATGTIRLGAFWGRRARRLVPALVVVLVAVAVWARLAADDAVRARLRGEAVATLAYVANWRDITAGASYWDDVAGPSPLAHAWSLAIEEQFYLVWPLVVLGVLRLTRSPRALLTLTGLAAVGSVVMSFVLYEPGSDPSRVYWGTDTRAAAILFGAVVALLAGRSASRVPRGLRPLATIGALGLAAAWATVPGTSDGLYRGGLAAAGIAVALVIGAVTRAPTGALARVLSLAPLRALGLISYGLYLWHWPVIVALTPGVVGLDGVALAVVRAGVSVALAIASYVLVEAPVRRTPARWPAWPLAPAGLAAAGVAVVALTAGAVAPPPATAALAPLASLPPPPTTAPPPTTTTTAVAVALVAEPTPTTTAAPLPARILVVGDSGAWYLGEGMARVAAEVGTEVVARGTIGCGVVRGSTVARRDDGQLLPDAEGCDGREARWSADLAAAAPDVVVLVLAWPGYGDRLIAGRWQQPCDAEFDAAYVADVVAALTLLGSHGAATALATAPYYEGDDAPPDVRTRVDCLNAAYREAAERAGAAVVDLAAYACPDGTCRIEHDGVELRPDHLHFADAGADAAARWLLPQLAALRPGTG